MYTTLDIHRMYVCMRKFNASGAFPMVLIIFKYGTSDDQTVDVYYKFAARN